MAQARRCLLGLGSNIADRQGNLQAALAALPQARVQVQACSSLYDTDPVGELPDQPAFLNACVLGSCELEPLELLDRVKELERRLGRELDAPRHGPRVIDIDILLLGELEHASERMMLPHEQLLKRRFVLIPALELDFELCTPAGERLADALAELPVNEGVRWAAPALAIPS